MGEVNPARAGLNVVFQNRHALGDGDSEDGNEGDLGVFFHFESPKIQVLGKRAKTLKETISAVPDDRQIQSPLSRTILSS